MTVAELIEKLKTLPPDARVTAFDREEYERTAEVEYEAGTHTVCFFAREPSDPE